MGTMVGDDGGTNRLGMSPAARWIGCRNMNQGFGTPASYIECFQWFVAPTDLNGANPDPAKAPHVINNSWGCPDFEGCSQDTLRQVVENTRAAGIVVVASAGNDGNNCSTVADPPSHYQASFTVGATNSSDGIAGFSSRGPVTVDGSNRRKPDVSAPGVGIRSSVPGGGYGSASGTSMAGPHVAGLVGLLLSGRPDLAGQVDVIQQIIERSALPRTTSQGCGGDSETAVPNNTFGYGRIDALAALTGDADGDGRSNLEDCRPVQAAVWAAPSPARDLRLAGKAQTTFVWSVPQQPGATQVTYDLLRSASAADFTTAACVVADTASPAATDGAAAAPGLYYLVRVRNACGAHLGFASSGAERTGAPCP
jgi:subtilisin family serine protease